MDNVETEYTLDSEGTPVYPGDKIWVDTQKDGRIQKTVEKCYRYKVIFTEPDPSWYIGARFNLITLVRK